MLRAARSPALQAVFIAATVLAGTARAQSAPDPGTVHDMPLPGGLRGALTAVDDRVPGDRSQFLLEFIRRSYDRPQTVKNRQRETVLQSLLAHFDRIRAGRSATTPAFETVPLPLPPRLWIDAVFGGRETADTLVSAIVRSRGASLLYYGLLSLDDPTRAWLATEPQLIRDLSAQHAAAFAAAAPALRVNGSVVRMPGGDAGRPGWEALVGHRADDPAGFVRALLGQEEGRLAYFFGAMAQLTPMQSRVAMALDSRDAAARVAGVRRMHAVFSRVAAGWRLDDRAFWRPALDPALLIAGLRIDDGGRPLVPGTRRFWNAVFSDDAYDPVKSNGAAGSATIAEPDPVDFAWLCEQVFGGERAGDRRRYELVLFTSRHIAGLGPGTVRDAVDTVRAAHRHPALIATLERAKLADVKAFAAAARKAARFSAIEDEDRAVRAIAQFQAALALVTRAASRAGLRSEAVARLVSSLSAVDVNERGDYEGRLVSWLDAYLRDAPRLPELDEGSVGPMEGQVLGMLAGPSDVEPRFVTWEGTRYRLDFAWAEARRLARLIGEQSRPFLSSARTLVALAGTLEAGSPSRERVQQAGDGLAQVADAVAWDHAETWEGTDVPRRYRDVTAALQRAAREGDVPGASRLAPSIRILADDLLARGLLEMVYAVALGQPDRSPISADDTARRHDFGMRSTLGRATAPWAHPIAGTGDSRGWHITGSVLGLDVQLGQFALVRLSSRLPARKPTLDDDQRRVLTETVALIEPGSLSDADRDTIVSAIRKGRAKLAAVSTPAQAAGLADEIELSAARRTLLSWLAANDPARVAFFLSPGDLLWLGLGTAPTAATLHAWGAPAESRTGCQCLRLTDRPAWETLAGRWHSGMVAGTFVDLNLRLAELLAELQMPAALLAPVLASATQDLIDTAATRDSDDRRGLVEFVHALRLERVEQYLALLTTDGPLVPAETGTAR